MHPRCDWGLAGNCFRMIFNMKTISDKSKSKEVPEGCGEEALISAGTRMNKRISQLPHTCIYRLTGCLHRPSHDVSMVMLSMFALSAFNIPES